MTRYTLLTRVQDPGEQYLRAALWTMAQRGVRVTVNPWPPAGWIAIWSEADYRDRT